MPPLSNFVQNQSTLQNLVSPHLNKTQQQLLIDAMAHMAQNKIFCNAFTKISDMQSVDVQYSDEQDTTLVIPIQLKCKEGMFDSDLSLSIGKDVQDKTSIQIAITCANEIYYDMPLDINRETSKFRNSAHSGYIPPTNTKLIYTQFLDIPFFALNKDYYFVINYTPDSKVPISINQATTYYSAKAAHSYPEYAPEVENIKDLAIHRHRGGVQKHEINYSFGKNGEMLSKDMIIDTFFRVLRECHHYKITPTASGCSVERMEYGTKMLAHHRKTVQKTVTQRIKTPIEDIHSFNELINEFELHCSNDEHSCLLLRQVDKNNSNSNSTDKKSTTVSPNVKKEKKTYQEIKQEKLDKHDKSILWHKMKEKQPQDEYVIHVIQDSPEDIVAHYTQKFDEATITFIPQLTIK